MTHTPPILELRDVDTFYGPVQAHFGLSLKVERAEIVCLLGGNASGKSTTMKIILGLVKPTAGDVLVDGTSVLGLSTPQIVRLGVGTVPEARRLFGAMSVRENLLMGAYTRKDRDGVARDIEQVFSYFPILKERMSQDAGLLSGGQQQMLAISRALMAKPDLMLLDEPSLGLSPKLTKEIFEIVVRINRERGTTILLVEQNANMALNAADYGYVLENGRIVMEDTCERLREKEDIKEFYLGMKDEGVRGERRWKKKKTWR